MFNFFFACPFFLCILFFVFLVSFIILYYKHTKQQIATVKEDERTNQIKFKQVLVFIFHVLSIFVWCDDVMSSDLFIWFSFWYYYDKSKLYRSDLYFEFDHICIVSDAKHICDKKKHMQTKGKSQVDVRNVFLKIYFWNFILNNAPALLYSYTYTLKYRNQPGNNHHKPSNPNCLTYKDSTN